MRKCPNHKFMCTSGLCISAAWKCDDYPDCPDGSDEHNCGKRACPILLPRAVDEHDQLAFLIIRMSSSLIFMRENNIYVPHVFITHIFKTETKSKLFTIFVFMRFILVCKYIT